MESFTQVTVASPAPQVVQNRKLREPLFTPVDQEHNVNVTGCAAHRHEYRRFWRFYEYLHNSALGFADCLGSWLDCFSCGELVDSYSSRRGHGVAPFAFPARQTWGSGPAH